MAISIEVDPSFITLTKKTGGKFVANVSHIQGIHENSDGAALVLERGGVEVTETVTQILSALSDIGITVTQA